MKKLLTALLIGLVSPILVPYIILEWFCRWFHWPYLTIIVWPLFIPMVIVRWAVSRLKDDNFKITLLHFLKLELKDTIK